MKVSDLRAMPLWWIKLFLVVFYAVGVMGFLVPITKPLFIAIIPFALLLSVFLLALYHTKFSAVQVLVFALIFVLGYIVEAMGVNTGLIFGNYTYGRGLGFQLFNTPLMIGVNWLFLTYTASSIADKLCTKVGFQLILAPSIMLFYDFLLEHLAPKMDMWSWHESIIPIQNYVAWWFIGFVFVGLFKFFKVPTNNPLALFLYICQYLFFLVLFLVFK